MPPPLDIKMKEIQTFSSADIQNSQSGWLQDWNLGIFKACALHVLVPIYK